MLKCDVSAKKRYEVQLSSKNGPIDVYLIQESNPNQSDHDISKSIELVYLIWSAVW